MQCSQWLARRGRGKASWQWVSKPVHMYTHYPLSPPTDKESILSLRHPEGAVGFRPATRGKKTEITKTGDFLTGSCDF